MFANRVLARSYPKRLGLSTVYWERSRVYCCIVTATGITETGGHTALEIKATGAQLAQSHFVF